MAKIDIIIPNYNNSKYLYRCIDSIIKQTEKDIRIIFIDDGSTDDSLKIIEKYKDNAEFEINIIKQFNQNASIARNRGIELINSEFCYFLDSDDFLYDNNVLELMLKKIGNSDIVIGNYKIIDERNNIVGEYNNKSEICKYGNVYDYVGLSPVPSNKLYRSSIIINNKLYFSNVRIGQDLNFYLKYLSFCKKIIIIDDYLYCYRILGNGMSNSKNMNFLDIYYCFEEIKKFYFNNNIITDYNKYISPVAIKHYHNQMVKVRFFKSHKKRKTIYTFFSMCVKSEKNNYLKGNNYYKREKRLYFVKKNVLLFGLYDFYKKLKNKKGGINEK